MSNLISKKTKQGHRAPRPALIARTIKDLKPGEWASAPAARGEGVLEARRLTNGGIRYYLRTTNREGKRDRTPLGIDITFNQAKQKATQLSLRYQFGERDLRKALKFEQNELDRLAREQEASAQVAAASSKQTLGVLLDAYATQLERDKKPSAREVRAALHHHVRDAWPALWNKPIEEIDADDLVTIVAAPANAGHSRQAEKIRAYLRAAFSAGVKARHNAKALPALRVLRMTANPARDLTPVAGANKARNRALSLAELRAYWSRIHDAPEFAPLRFHLLTGCQRIQQLARATQADVDVDTQSLRLLDIKGRRTSARQHYVPLLPAAVDAMHAMQSRIAGPYVFTVTAGVSGADYAGIFKRVRKVAEAMHLDGELPGGLFTPGDLRRTVETRLADAGVSREVRAHLQSHGLGGVQERYYDRNDYLPATRAALETLERLFTGGDANVVSIKRNA